VGRVHYRIRGKGSPAAVAAAVALRKRTRRSLCGPAGGNAVVWPARGRDDRRDSDVAIALARRRAKRRGNQSHGPRRLHRRKRVAEADTARLERTLAFTRRRAPNRADSSAAVCGRATDLPRASYACRWATPGVRRAVRVAASVTRRQAETGTPRTLPALRWLKLFAERPFGGCGARASRWRPSPCRRRRAFRRRSSQART
jgi:hypothetical protein